MTLPPNAITHLVVVGEANALPSSVGPVTLVSCPEGSTSTITGTKWTADRQGLYVLRLGNKGAGPWHEVTIYAAPTCIDAHPVYRVEGYRPLGRKLLGNLLADTPRERLDFAHVTEAHPWPLVFNGREWSGPDWQKYGKPRRASPTTVQVFNTDERDLRGNPWR
jgi:hypothetical protein